MKLPMMAPPRPRSVGWGDLGVLVVGGWERRGGSTVVVAGDIVVALVGCRFAVAGIGIVAGDILALGGRFAGGRLRGCRVGCCRVDVRGGFGR